MDGKKSYEIESSCYHLDENKTNSGEKKEKIRKKIKRKKKDLHKIAAPILQRMLSKPSPFYACELFLVILLLHILRFFVQVLWMFAI